MRAMIEFVVPLGDVELCAGSFGDPADPTILLLSGATATMDWWADEWCERLAAGDSTGGRYVIRYDHRDTGRSTTGEPGRPAYDGGAFDTDAAGLLRTLGVEPAHLVGLSMGGGIAQRVALTHPELVSGLTLIATSAVGGVDDELPRPTDALQARFADRPPDPGWSDREAVAAWFLDSESAFAGALGVDEPAVREAAERTFARSVDLAAAGNHWRVMTGGTDLGEVLDVAAIDVPTLVVHGSNDPLFPLPHGEALARVIPGAQLMVVDGMGHQVPPRSTWDEVIPAILANVG